MAQVITLCFDRKTFEHECFLNLLYIQYEYEIRALVNTYTRARAITHRVNVSGRTEVKAVAGRRGRLTRDNHIYKLVINATGTNPLAELINS